MGGSKNAIVAAIPAALLGSSPSTLENVPLIRDVVVFLDIVGALGAGVHFDAVSRTVKIDPKGFSARAAPYELVKRLRASYYLLGVLVAKFGRAEVALPGGCEIGIRPVDQHLKAIRALGAEVTMEHGVIRASAPRGLAGTAVYLDVVSVGATINLMLAATGARGTTVIGNAAKEPHIVDLANYLNAMGAKIQGAGTDVIRIKGMRDLSGASHAVIPDDIEAGTYLLAGVATRGCITVRDVITKHLEPLKAKLLEMGVRVVDQGDAMTVEARNRPKAVSVRTLPYPGFPTDLQQPLAAVLARADGVGVIQENIYDNRFGYANELIRMGARIKVDGRTAIVEGVEKLYGAPVRATDLRGGAALVVAGLGAEGRTSVYGVYHIDRGYELIENKLLTLGASVKRVLPNRVEGA